ncbi:Gamma-D-glutamyl-L-diamino acid endopeptidase 1 [Anaerohalosphaera lusitana]|uniref:Gamma-D-glutamyl-L-diamino acid endopeptidase 1 n=1 Tax=Anaerohalosphaera lusitana TaxID=1936003 RepID=A0A1U9NP23_9BACT|nr:DUF2817 domain-containing protein [Anaerohalosphaera lusitana]AQT69663.1 Gamma-D-glutamyl-L-diamino acid endopeptidase 1 [Anaerohalosphaera lusitana]
MVKNFWAGLLGRYASGILTVCLFAFMAAGIAGCDTWGQERVSKPEFSWSVPGKSVQGRPIECLSMGNGERTVLVMATIHGDEFAGTPLVRKMIDHLNKNPQKLARLRVVVMPMANPDGYALGQRYNANGVDLNRNFEAENRVNNEVNGPRGLSEPESRVIRDIIRSYRPERIITLHQPLECVDYDGPAGDVAYAMARCCDLPLNKLGSRPGSLGAYAGERLSIPTVTVELREEDSQKSADELWRAYGRMLLAGVFYPEPVTDFIVAK